MTAVVAGRHALFVDAPVAAVVDEELMSAHEQAKVDAIAWVVMPDHMHWMFALGDLPLGDVMRGFKSRSARRVNALLGVHGALWQQGYYDHQLRRDEDLAGQARYILANPVRAGLADVIGEYPHAWCRYSL